MPRGLLTFTYKFPLFPRVFKRKFPFAMYSILLDHKVFGPSSHSSKGYPVVTRVTQITKNVPFALAYYRDTWHYPSWNAELVDMGGATHIFRPKSKGP